ncbi:hypothetical protein ACX1NX_00570 [Acinetobacter sp. ANC 5383]
MVIEVGDIVLYDATATKGDLQPKGNLVVQRIWKGKYCNVIGTVDSLGKEFIGSEDIFKLLKKGN